MCDKEIAAEVTQEQFELELGEKIMNNGLVATKVVGLGLKGGAAQATSASVAPALSSTGPWIIGGIIYTVKTGIDYRKYK